VSDTLANVCRTCKGQACEYGCGECFEFPGTAGPDAHRMCVSCLGSGVEREPTIDSEGGK
jgi:hypothetical protein